MIAYTVSKPNAKKKKEEEKKKKKKLKSPELELNIKSKLS